MLSTLDLSEDWWPTPENINALPKPLRRYIHDLQTNVDPAGTMRENFRLRQENAALRRECEWLGQERYTSGVA
jgi:hypothetical protein